jgi:predicted molibdopterin-dependent oxidoreductase YjgC
MQEMSRCIHCTRCVRFGQEVAGVMELGMSHRGEHAEIETFVGMSVDSELSGNMIDICPVGASDQQAFPLQRPHLGALAPQVGQPARLDRRQPDCPGQEQQGHACGAA